MKVGGEGNEEREGEDRKGRGSLRSGTFRYGPSAPSAGKTSAISVRGDGSIDRCKSSLRSRRDESGEEASPWKAHREGRREMGLQSTSLDELGTRLRQRQGELRVCTMLPSLRWFEKLAQIPCWSLRASRKGRSRKG